MICVFPHCHLQSDLIQLLELAGQNYWLVLTYKVVDKHNRKPSNILYMFGIDTSLHHDDNTILRINHIYLQEPIVDLIDMPQ